MKQTVGIIGLGYVGAPLAFLAAAKGYNVIGIDTNVDKIYEINNKINVPLQIVDFYKNNKVKLSAFTDYEKLRSADIIVICVPTPTINNVPDLSILNNVIDNLAGVMKEKCLLIVESTIAPGMTRKYVEKRLSKVNSWEINKNYELAYCPERIDPGNKKYWVGNINRVCGADTKRTLDKACKFYSSIIDADVIPMGSIEEAELVKVWENSLRNISIAQANLLAKICDKYDFSVKRVLKGLNSKVDQFGLSLSLPGIGPGGHCIPEDIHYLIQAVKDNKNVNMNLFEESVKINDGMPKYALKKLRSIIKRPDNLKKDKIVILGSSYKPNSNDTRKSQALVLFDLIKKINKNITLFDPVVDNVNAEEVEGLLDNVLSDSKIIILGCAHDVFLNIDFKKYPNIKYVFDCWNKLDKSNMSEDIVYTGIGDN